MSPGATRIPCLVVLPLPSNNPIVLPVKVHKPQKGKSVFPFQELKVYRWKSWDQVLHCLGLFYQGPEWISWWGNRLLDPTIDLSQSLRQQVSLFISQKEIPLGISLRSIFVSPIFSSSASPAHSWFFPCPWAYYPIRTLSDLTSHKAAPEAASKKPFSLGFDFSVGRKCRWLSFPVKQPL